MTDREVEKWKRRYGAACQNLEHADHERRVLREALGRVARIGATESDAETAVVLILAAVEFSRSDSNWSKRPTADLEAEANRYLDWADENDDEGGHVGFSRLYRERSYAIDAELHRRRLSESNWSKRPSG